MGLIKDIIRYLKKNIARIIAYAIISFICAFFAQSCANAQSISNNLRTISDTYLNYYENIYNQSDYKYAYITSEYVNNNSYNTYTIYYLCLTNDDASLVSSVSLNTSCDSLYSYYSYSNNYYYNVYQNQSLILNNTIYYSLKKESYIFYLWIICFALFLIFMIIIFNRILRNRYGGLKYGRINA